MGLFLARGTKPEVGDLRRLILLAVACGLWLPTNHILAAPPKKPTKTQTAKNKLKTVKAKQVATKKEIHAVREERDEQRDQLQLINSRIRRINGVIEETQDRIVSRKAEQRKSAAALAEANVKLVGTRNKIRSRIRAMYRQGESPVVMVLIGSQDAASFASRKSLLERIAKRDRDLFKEMKIRRQAVSERKKEVDRLVKEVLDLEETLRGQQATAMEAQEDKVAIIKGLNRKEDLLEKQLDELEAESNRLADVISSYQSASRSGSSNYVIPWRGGLVRPTRGRLTSGFGYRVHPISHRRKLHAGVDLAAPTGTPIVAAAPGVVISSGQMRGYGNVVVIDHGGGFSTLYGHCSRLIARAGQRVSAGQRIALVGSTGYSTGPHLHFETRVNGRPVNPLSRL